MYFRYLLVMLISLQWIQTSFASQFEVGAIHNYSSDDIYGYEVNIPIENTGDAYRPIVWDLSLAQVKAKTATGGFVQSESGQVAEYSDGEADYLIIGVGGRKVIIPQYRIEAVIRTTYGMLNQSKTAPNRHGIENYDPMGGVNISAGMGISLKRSSQNSNEIESEFLQGDSELDGVMVHLMLHNNIRSGKNSLQLKISYRKKFGR